MDVERRNSRGHRSDYPLANGMAAVDRTTIERDFAALVRCGCVKTTSGRLASTVTGPVGDDVWSRDLRFLRNAVSGHGAADADHCRCRTVAVPRLDSGRGDDGLC